MKKLLHLTLLFTFLYSTLYSQLSGTYLIDLNGGGDYNSLTEAANALNSQGMNGNVTLQLASGLYAEQVLFEVTGQTEDELLTIESLSGIESDVIFRFEETTEEENYQIAFQEIKALSILNISINTEGLDAGVGIDFKGNCSNVLIDNLHHVGNNNDEGILAYYSIDFFSPPGSLNDFTIINSYFHLSSSSISIGETLFLEPDILAQNISITNNEFYDADGINIKFAINVEFSNNIAQGDVYRVQPVKLQNCSGDVLILENKIWHSFFTFDIQLCDGTASNPILIANNFISGSEELLKFSSNTYLKFVYNSVFADDDSHLGIFSGNSNTDIINNIFYQDNVDGTLFLIYFITDNSTVDNNNMYSNGSYAIDLVGGFPTGLNYDEYKSTTGNETNGINVQPVFIIPGEDLHATNQALNEGFPLDEITTDIDGENRDVSNPTIGADEIGGVIIVNDLTIDTVITSGDLIAGEQISIEWSGSNAGGEDFQAPWVDRIFLSQDEVIDDLDIELGDYSVGDDLGAGADYLHQEIISLSLELSGTYYIIIKIDADAQLIEDNSNNILASVPFTVSPPDLPNLVVTDIEMPANIFSGTTLQINFTVTNQGQAPASGNWTEIAWLETDIDGFNQASYFLQNTAFAEANNIIGLMPGESYIGTLSAETNYIGQGWHYIRIQTDGGDDVIEENGTNDNFSNALIDSVFVNQSPLADLIIEDIQTPTETFAGEEISISYTVLNEGTETTSPVELPFNFYFGYVWVPLLGDWVDYTYFRDSVVVLNPDNYQAVATRFGNLEVDSSYVVIETIQIPECESGPYFITAYADRWNHVAELDESNNAMLSDTIFILPRPAPDLIPESDDPLANLASNEMATLSYRIVNQGADTANGSWYDRVFLSDSATFQYDIDEMIGNVSQSLTLAPDEQVELTIDIDIPPQMYGNKFLYLWIDAINDICEQPYDTNNVLRIPVSITQSPAADLEISFIPPSSELIAGDEPDLSSIVSNIGSSNPNINQWQDIIFILSEGGVSDTVYKEVYEQNTSLAPNSSYNLPNPFLIPLDISPGFYSLGIMTDALNTVWENESEQNNIVLSDPFQVSLDSSRVPDLEAIEISTENWQSGQTYDIEIAVNNSSAPTGIATWIDEIYLESISGEKLASATGVFSGNLDSDQTYTLAIELEIPLGTPSTVFLVARIDTANNVLEYNLANNILSLPITVISGDAPDLSPTDLLVTTEVNAGQEIDISLFRNNFGDVSISNDNWVDKVLLSFDDIPSNNDITLRSYAFTSSSFPSQTSEMHIDSIQVPLTLTGNYFVIYYMDANDNLSEGVNEDNNYIVSDAPLQILTPAPIDFSSELISFNITDGNLDNLQYSITNTGNESFTGKFYNTYYLSNDSIYSLDDQLLGWDQVADYDAAGNQITLDPSESTDRYASFIYTPVIAGNYYVIQRVDALLNVYETDETNNTITFGPVFLDNVEEIFPDIVYNKQFGRNMPSVQPINGFTFGMNNSTLGPDRHDYKITIPDGFGMITHMWENESANEAYGINNESQPIYEMYIGEEYIPSPLEFDFRFDSPLQAEQFVLVPVAGDRTDYIKTTAPYIPPHFDPDSLPISQYHLQAELKEFSVFTLHPEKVGTAHNVTLRIKGFDLEDTLGLDVALIHQLDTVYAFETYPQNSSELIAYIDMRNSDAGEYQLMVRKQTTGAFTIWEEVVEVIDDIGPLYYSKVSAPSETRLPNEFIINVNYGNLGYSNEYDMGLYVAFFFLDTNGVETKTSAGINVEFLGAGISGEALNGFISDELNPAEIIDYGDFGFARIYATRIPIVHARFEESLTFKVTPSETGTLVTQSTLAMIRRSPYSFTGRIEDADSSFYSIMLGQAIAEVEGALETAGNDKSGGNCGQVLNADQMTFRIAQETKKVADIAHGSTGFIKGVRDGISDLFGSGSSVEKRYEGYKSLVESKGSLSLTADDDTPFVSELQDIFNCIEYDSTGSGGCWQTRTWSQNGQNFSIEVYTCDPGGKLIPPEKPQPPKPGPIDRFVTWVRNAVDPNEIVGPAGEGLNRLVDNDEDFLYTIYFENVPEATAPAARVRIDNPLDSNLRLQSFRVVSFGFADTSFQFNNAPFVQQSIDLGTSFNGQYLQIIGGTNPDSQKAFFEFTTINPETQGIVTGANEGFLLPNDSTGRGQGYITYLIKAKNDLDPGTVISNDAAIIFDENEVIETNIWSNIIMGGDLASKVNTLPEFSSTEFDLSWSNETPLYGPTLKSFDIYIRDVTDSTEWTKWLGDTKALSKKFSGIPGHTYDFFSKARSEDSFETYKNNADATTTIIDFKGDLSGGNLVLYPNPTNFGDVTQLAFSSPGSDIAMRVELTDVQGRKFQSIPFTTVGEGIQYIDIPIYNLGAGIYVVGLYKDNERIGSAKLIVSGYSEN